MVTKVFKNVYYYLQDCGSSLYEYFFCRSFDLKPRKGQYEYDEFERPDNLAQKGICSICMESLFAPFCSDRRFVKTISLSSCHHNFHLPCIIKWLNVHSQPTCPICRIVTPLNAELFLNCQFCEKPLITPQQSRNTLCFMDIICLPLCRHKFHMHCIINWLNNERRDETIIKLRCPVCGMRAPHSDTLLQYRHQF